MLERIWGELENSSWSSILAQSLRIAGKRAGLTGYVPGLLALSSASVPGAFGMGNAPGKQ